MSRYHGVQSSSNMYEALLQIAFCEANWIIAHNTPYYKFVHVSILLPFEM